MIQHWKPYLFIGCFFLGFIPWANSTTQAETMFEGYYKIVSGGTKIGYFIQSYEFDPKEKKFISTYFIQTNNLGGNIIESLRASANNKFQPISYQYTAKTPRIAKTIDASFKNNIMNAVITEGNQSQTVSRRIPKGTFLSTFLGYLILQEGYSLGKKFNYRAIAEERAESYRGEAHIKSQQTFLGKTVFKVFNIFNGIKFISYVTDKGEVLGTQSPLQKISTELVPFAVTATKEFALPTKSLKLLFGQIPLGKTNVFSRLKKSQSFSAEPEPIKVELSPKKSSKEINR